MLPSNNFSQIPPARGQFPHSISTPDTAIYQVCVPVTDFTCYEIPPDGDCLFRGVHMGLNQPEAQAPELEVRALRWRVVDYLGNNSQALAEIEDFEGLEGVRHLYDLLCTPGAWNRDVGALVIPLLAQVLGREIIILQSCENNSVYTLQYTSTANNLNFPPGGDNTGEPPIHLLRLAGGTHYAYLERCNTQLNAQQVNSFTQQAPRTTSPSLTAAEQANIDADRFQRTLQIPTPTINDLELESQLQDWVNTGPAAEEESRALVKHLIITAFRKNEATLDLSCREISALPPAIGHLTNLKKLECYETEITSLPDTIGNLTKLQELDCSWTSIESLPDTIGNLLGLQKLDCSQTLIQSLPEAIGNLTKLQELSCYEIEISSIPDIIGNLTELQVFDCSNTLIASLPETIGNLKQLQQFDCSNTLLCSFPDTIGHLTNLRQLDCYQTYIRSLPDTIGHLTHLEQLDCNHTNIRALPDTIGRLVNLKQLRCAYTPITSFPNIRGLGQLTELYLNDCHLPSISLRALPENRDLRVYLSNNWFSANTIESLVQAQGEINYRGPTFSLSINDSLMDSSALTAEDIDQALKALGYTNTTDFAALREAIRPRYGMSDVGNDFTHLLVKINNRAPKNNGHLVGRIKTHINNVLQTLDQLHREMNNSAQADKKEKIKKTIESILVEAAGANTSCVDRALVHLLIMSAKCSLNNATTPESVSAIDQDIQHILDTMNFISCLNSRGENKLIYDKLNHNFISPFEKHSGDIKVINVSDEIEDILVLLNSGLLTSIEGIDMNFEACATLSNIDRENNRGHSLVDAAKIYILNNEDPAQLPRKRMKMTTN